MVDNIIFWVFAAMALAASLGVVLHRSIIYSALFLIVVFMSIAGFFVLNNADFLAIAQMIVYAVGLTIIVLFAIMFTGDRQFPLTKQPKALIVAYGVVVAYVFALLVKAVLYPFPTVRFFAASPLGQMLQEKGSTEMLGALLFQKYSLPFELASILLLIAMIGAIVLAKRRFEPTHLGDTKLEIDMASMPTEDAVRALKGMTPLQEVSAEGPISLTAVSLDAGEAVAEKEAGVK